MAEKITWYSYNEHEQYERQPPVDLAAALEVARRYYAYADTYYETKGASRAAQCFGIWRDDGTYIEIWVQRPNIISYTFKTDAPLPPNATELEHQIDAKHGNDVLTLKSWEELEEKIRQFYTEDPAEIRRKLCWQKAVIPPYKIVLTVAMLACLLLGQTIYSEEVKRAACRDNHRCRTTAGIFIAWPFYVWGPGAVK